MTTPTNESSTFERLIESPARRAQELGTFRWIEVRLMEVLASWVPTTPEMEVKLLLGEHLYELARHADALGHRTRELRAPLHHSVAPVAAWRELVERVAGTSATADRLAGFYGVLLPGLAKHYRRTLERADPILDGPTVRLVEDVLRDAERMEQGYEALRRELPELPAPSEAWVLRRSEEEAAVTELVEASEALSAAEREAEGEA